MSDNDQYAGGSVWPGLHGGGLGDLQNNMNQTARQHDPMVDVLVDEATGYIESTMETLSADQLREIAKTFREAADWCERQADDIEVDE